MSEKLPICGSHPEYPVPLIHTLVFTGAELWCPYCNDKVGAFDCEMVDETPELKERLRRYRDASWKYLNAHGAFTCIEMIWHGVRVKREDLPKSFLDEQRDIIMGYELGVKGEDLGSDMIVSYQHVRNKNCIYERVGDTDEFKWADITRSEGGILQEIHYNQKFIPYEAIKSDGTKYKVIEKDSL